MDISESFVAARAAEAGLGNVLAVLSGHKSTELPPAIVDLVFTLDTYHRFAYPRAVREEVIGEVEQAGFKLIDEPTKLLLSYFLTLSKS